ncbi:MAG TPA: tetratricopeptide repeat protein [Pirellulales bacterium]|jgi:tetratricopeptide (TPR) repeat protein|nr:tetratricopeptide repeat protein [Pirellulales bacterium]
MSRRKRGNSTELRAAPASRRSGGDVGGAAFIASADARLPQAAASSSRLSTLVCVVLIAGATVAAYHNSLRGPFVFDDSYWIVENPSIRHLWPIWDVLFSERAISYGGRPVVALSLAVNYACGANVWGYHAMNVAIHFLAALTLFGVIRRTLSLPRLRDRFGPAATPLALIATLLWTVHPLQTSAVTYVIQRAETLVSLFYLLIIYCVIRGANASESSSKRSKARYIGAVAAAVLGAATKEVVVTAPAVLLLYDRAFLSGSFRNSLAQRWGLYLALVASWGVTVWGLVSTRLHAGSVGFAVSEFTWWSYLLTQPGVLLHYLRMAVWPSGLALDYGWPRAQTFGEIVPAAALIVGMLGFTFWAVVKRPVLGFLPAAFFLILAPTSSFVPILDAAFDHRMYLALAPVVVLAVSVGYVFLDRRLSRPTATGAQFVVRRWAAPLAALTAILIALCSATIKRNDDFRSDVAIWQDTVDKRPQNARAHNGLGDAFKDQGNTEQALAQYEQALEIKPELSESFLSLLHILSAQDRLDRGIEHARQVLKSQPRNPQAHNNLAGFLAAADRPDEALVQFKQALAIDSDNLDTHIRLADFFFHQGKLDDAIAQYQLILRAQPDAADTRNNWARALAAQGHDAAALAEARRALEIKPDLAPAHLTLADVFAHQGKADEATVELKKALEINPDFAEAHHNLGFLLANRGKTDEAIAHFQRALEIKPDLAEAHNNLAVTLERSGKDDAAIEHFRKAIEIYPRYPEAHNNLGALLSNRGNFDDAITHLRKAIELRPDYDEARKNLDLALQRRDASVLRSSKLLPGLPTSAGKSKSP